MLDDLVPKASVEVVLRSGEHEVSLGKVVTFNLEALADLKAYHGAEILAELARPIAVEIAQQLSVPMFRKDVEIPSIPVTGLCVVTASPVLREAAATLMRKLDSGE